MRRKKVFPEASLLGKIIYLYVFKESALTTLISNISKTSLQVILKIKY